ncbi:MAG: YicC family protein [Acidobacteriia bacterium]|nr:YicC family protein [Terriglobia bacterium]
MIFSMTGFGQGQVSGDDFVLAVTLKTVNHRFFDVSLRLPQEFQCFENRIKNLLKQRLVRGSVSAAVNLEKSGEVEAKLNQPLAAAYLRAAQEMKSQFNLSSDVSVDTLLRLPNVVVMGNGNFVEEGPLREKYQTPLEQALEAALAQVNEMRTREGAQLEQDLKQRTMAIADRVELIDAAVRSGEDALFEKLTADVSRMTADANLDRGRLAQEVAYLAEKSDVTEEITRLRSHLQQFLEMLKAEGEIGKKLDFLLQEMQREANTILSKTASVPGPARQAGDHGIAIKAEIEKLREQVQNVV